MNALVMLRDKIAHAMASNAAKITRPLYSWSDVIRDSRLTTVVWDPHEGLFAFFSSNNIITCVAFGNDLDNLSLEEQLQSVASTQLDTWSLIQSYESGQQIALMYCYGDWQAICESSVPVPDARYV